MDVTELEARLAGKIPGEDTGIEVKKTFCAICAPMFHCGIDAYVKDGKVIKIEGTKGHPMNDGLLCTKGSNNRAYIYREDRIRTPLKRVGERGEGKFVPISWDEAYDTIAEKLLETREKYGANAVAFFGGYDKWFRFMFQRFAFVFGSRNYGTESSACFTSSRMAWTTMTGLNGKADMAHANLAVVWGGGTHHSRYKSAVAVERLKERGGKVIVIDPRLTPAAQNTADLYLQVTPGTDGILANCIAGIIIRSGWHDKEYIEKYVHGFTQYAEHVCSLNIAEVSCITGVPEEKIYKAAEMIGTIRPMSCESNPTSIIHQTNGYQTVRAIFALSVVTGNYDRVGGNIPMPFTFCEQDAGFDTCEHEFETERTPEGYEDRIGARKYPVWAKLVHQMQATDLPRTILEGTPEPVHALFALGMNHRIFPQSEYFKDALRKLDFVVDADIFLTESAKMADIVLPACTSFEREEIKVYPGGYAKYYAPVIEPLYESRSDARILQDLANRMELDDELLRGGYRKCIENIFAQTGLDMEEMIALPLPVKAPHFKPFEPLVYLEGGCKTPTGKLELYSELVASCPAEKKLNPLPVWYPPHVRPDEKNPFLLLTGVRIPNAIHTRLHKIPWARSLRPDPMADISPADAKRLGVEYGDTICLYNEFGSVTVKANPTEMVADGQVFLYHGYEEADASMLLSRTENDPYSGFPGLKCGSCNIRRCEEAIQ